MCPPTASAPEIPLFSSLDNSTVKHISFLYFFLRKEVIQPHLPIRLPCYDFTPVIGPTFDGSSLSVRSPASGVTDSHGDGRCVQDPGTYSPQYADLRLLAIPTSRRRVAAYDPN